MAKIMNVDYEAIPSQAKQMRTYGQELNNEITTVYTSITNMHNSWYGKRYNSLVKEFNNIIPQINELLELVVGEIPFALETIANNYSVADRGTKVTSAIKTEPKKATNLAMPGDVGMKFITSEVETIQKNISTNFKNAENKMNTIEVAYSKIQWESEAAEAFKIRFLKLKKDIIASFQNINTQFTNLMNQTLQDIQNTENANTVH